VRSTRPWRVPQGRPVFPLPALLSVPLPMQRQMTSMLPCALRMIAAQPWSSSLAAGQRSSEPIGALVGVLCRGLRPRLELGGQMPESGTDGRSLCLRSPASSTSLRCGRVPSVLACVRSACRHQLPRDLPRGLHLRIDGSNRQPLSASLSDGLSATPGVRTTVSWTEFESTRRARQQRREQPVSARPRWAVRVDATVCRIRSCFC
jgi:hypothetical protein